MALPATGLGDQVLQAVVLLGHPLRLQPVIDVAYMIKRHLYGLLNYFSAARITNAAAEGLKSKIQTIKKMAYGNRNREHFKTAIFFHCGGLQLYPHPLESR